MNHMRQQADQICAALESASRLGWEVTIGSGRGSVLVTARRVAIYPGTRETEYDRTGISIARTTLRDALGHLLTVITIEAAGESADEHERTFNHLRDLRPSEVSP